MKKQLTTILAALSLVSFIFINTAFADKAGMNLFNKAGGWINDIEGTEFGKQQIVFQIEGYNPQVTTVENLLTAARELLAEEQTAIFTLPLSVAYLQKIAYIQIALQGDKFTDLRLSGMPAQSTGLGNMAIVFSGDTTLPLKVATKLFSDLKKNSLNSPEGIKK